MAPNRAAVSDSIWESDLASVDPQGAFALSDSVLERRRPQPLGASSAKSDCTPRPPLVFVSMAALLSLPHSQPLLLRRRLARPVGKAAVLRCSSSLRTPNPSGVPVDGSPVSPPSDEVRYDGQNSSESVERLQMR